MFDFQDKILTLPAIFIAFTFHEFAHAYVADKLGDDTPRMQGRLTLNPLSHVDPIGLILILLVGFGWAKPVQTNPRAYKNYYKDDLKVSIAGPMANLAIALVFALGLGVFLRFGIDFVLYSSLGSIIYSIIQRVIIINIALFIFNLIPIPPLDGSHILRDLFPSIGYKLYDRLGNYQMVILIVFVASPLSDYVIGVPSRILYSAIIKITSLIYL